MDFILIMKMKITAWYYLLPMAFILVPDGITTQFLKPA